jgi:hypothetical protein
MLAIPLCDQLLRARGVSEQAVSVSAPRNLSRALRSLLFCGLADAAVIHCYLSL